MRKKLLEEKKMQKLKKTLSTFSTLKSDLSEREAGVPDHFRRGSPSPKSALPHLLGDSDGTNLSQSAENGGRSNLGRKIAYH